MLLAVYVLTLAPGVTFWDAGEFIAAAHGLGIPHPPGTPLYVAAGRVWVVVTGGVVGSARAMNVLSALASAAAGALLAGAIARSLRGVGGASWGALAGAIAAGLACSVWANATETEVYGVALLHAAAMLAVGLRAGESSSEGRWVLLLVWLAALAPAVHLSALLAAPAAIVAASYRGPGAWDVRRAARLGGALLLVAAVGLVSPWPAVAGAMLLVAGAAPTSWFSGMLQRPGRTGGAPPPGKVGRGEGVASPESRRSAQSRAGGGGPPTGTVAGHSAPRASDDGAPYQDVAGGGGPPTGTVVTPRPGESPHSRTGQPGIAVVLLVVLLGASALLILLVRALHEPPLNQGRPDTWAALADVVSRRQYPDAGLWPRQAPAWWQLANVIQYADWQFAMGWGRGIFTTPARITVTIAYASLGILGWRSLRRESPRTAAALATLLLCGTLGAASYLNLKAGASLGHGVIDPSLPHEARERDYFFVLGYWAWGYLAGWGALVLARRRGRAPLALLVAAVPLIANWPVLDRSRGAQADAARQLAAALLTDAPRGAVLFTAGDNDSYPLWYLQQVEGIRQDVDIVVVPLLPADWYHKDARRRVGAQGDEPVAPSRAPWIRWQHEQRAMDLASSARRRGRPVAASPALTARERALLGGGWTLGRAVLVSSDAGGIPGAPPRVDPRAASAAASRARSVLRRALPDDASPRMLGLLECPRLGAAWPGTQGSRDSLEVSCNFR